MKTREQLQRDVQDELKWEPRIDEAGIGVSVEDGVVTLSGHVSSFAERTSAERATKRVAGVKAIANELVVKLPFSMERDDTDIAEAAVKALGWRSDIPGDTIKVTVSKGWLTLEGDLDWNYQKESATNAVRYLTGVKGISNLIRIKPRVDASRVREKIEDALTRSAEVDARNIAVSVEGGKVTLRGKVRSWAERDDANDAAWAAPGVTEVEDNLRVEDLELAH
jgi:osmotically-inducible protein OsmY